MLRRSCFSHDASLALGSTIGYERRPDQECRNGDKARASALERARVRVEQHRCRRRRHLLAGAVSARRIRSLDVSDERLDTAHEVWDRWWGDARQRAQWDQPHPFVTGFIPELRARGSTRVVDVGGGIGRHAIAYAQADFGVVMTDASTTGIAETIRVAQTVGIQVDARVAPFTALPVEGASVDHVLAWNVLCHGRL